jgi:hypothetical protein
MKPTISMYIGSTHLNATVGLSPPSWLTRTSQLWKSRSGHQREKPGSESHGADSAQVARSASESFAFADRSAVDDPIQSIVEAGELSLQSLRDQHSVSLDGCNLSVRLGMSHTSLNITPLDASSASPSERQLHLIAEAVALESARTSTEAQTVKFEIQPNSTHLCIVGLNSSVLAALQSLCVHHGMKLASCQPSLVETLDHELAGSLRARDLRTLVWTEHGVNGERQPLVTFVRIERGNAIRAWRTLVPAAASGTDIDQTLQTTTVRFLLAAGAGQEDKVVFASWPHAPARTAVDGPLEAIS